MPSHTPLLFQEPLATLLTTRRLRSSGLSKREIARAITDGELVRVRRGAHVHGRTHPDVVRAARLGGRLDCVSLLRQFGVFVLDCGALHVQVDPLASRLPEPPPGAVRHWRPSAVRRDALVTDVVEALVQATRCQGPRAAIATLDSAWHRGLIDDAGLAEVFSRLPRRYRRLRPLLDRRSESGPESMMRLILRALGCRFDLQVMIPGVGRVDFLVDGWLIVECDSEEFHGGWQKQKDDRRRDLAAVGLGFVPVRVIAEDILWHRDRVAHALRAVLDARRQLIPVSTPEKTRPRAAEAP